MENWINCGLCPHTLDVIRSLGFKQMTPVQTATIPLFLRNKDVAVEAVTGSGKTLAFVIPIVEMLIKKAKTIKKHEIFSLLISPTRELASQISEVVSQFLSGEATRCFTQMLLIGGRGEMTKDLEHFEENGAHIVIGTPGRINSAFETSKLFCSAVRSLDMLILDEADRLLDLGFHQTLSSILSHLPKQRRTGLFSATQTEETEKLVKAGLRNPVKITVKQKISATEDACVRTPTTLKNYYVICNPIEKFNKLMLFLKSHKNEKHLVFFSTCASVDYFGRAVKEFMKTTEVSLIHGKMRKKRMQIFSDFREKKSGILICTDVMARGVDIPEVHWVLQFDPPSNANAFVHRCGRTARIGRQGNALIFLLENEQSYVDFMQINQKAPIYEYKEPEESSNGTPDYLRKLLKFSISDRAMMERGTRAFVSFIQSYAKHECSLIFRLKDMDLGELASGFALLQLPKMPELKRRKILNFNPPEVNISEVKYKDKAREKLRQKELTKQKNGETEFKNKKKFINNSWSKNKERMEKKQKRKEYKRKRKLKEANEFNDKELEELEDDARLVKKLKKGKISQEEFDEKMKL